MHPKRHLLPFETTCSMTVMVLILTSRAIATPPSFAGLGELPGGSTSTSASAVSSDGSTVVGSSFSESGGKVSIEAFRWTSATGMVGLGDLQGGPRPFSSFSGSAGVSGDGTVVVGFGMSDVGYEATRWTVGAGMIGLAPLIGEWASECTGVSGDGAVMVGFRITNKYESFRLTSAGEPTWLGNLGGETKAAVAMAISGDGSTIVGYSASPQSNPKGSGEPFRWTEAEGMIGLGFLPGGQPIGEAYATSGDGRVIVGRSNSAEGAMHAFRWTPETGMIGLGDLLGGAFGSLASAISSDGTIIVGYGTSASGEEAVVWEQGQTIARVADSLLTHGVVIPAGWILTQATGVTVNCSTVTMVGRGVNPNGITEAWISRYSLSTPCEGDVTRDSDVNSDDLLTVINTWGPCLTECCAGDIVPPAGDGTVDIDDLLAVINAWGPCS